MSAFDICSSTVELLSLGGSLMWSSQYYGFHYLHNFEFIEHFPLCFWNFSVL